MTIVILHLSAYENGIDGVFRNVGIQNSDAGELPRRKHITFRTWRKSEIKKKHFDGEKIIVTCIKTLKIGR
jgi:hypothetical protein